MERRLRPTMTEQLVLNKLWEGLSTHETAQVLNISIRTVQKHMEHLRRKFDVVCSVQLIRKALELGILSVSDKEQSV